MDEKEIKKCKFVEVNVEKQLPNMYISLYLSHSNKDYFNKSDFANIEKNNQHYNSDCKIILVNEKFLLNKSQ